MKDLGLLPSGINQCLFISPTVICVVYVDDCLLFSRDANEIEKVVDGLGTKFDLGYEDTDVAGFLGIQLPKNENGTLELKQTGLIDRILATMGLDQANGKHTPAEFGGLAKDTDGHPCCEGWEYAFVVGKLMYLAANTRPDIAFAVHQCARFTHHPRATHEIALKRIGQYLLKTRDRGMVIAPESNLKLDCFCNADFVGLYGHEDDQDPVSVNSRSGYVCTLGEIPFLWGSKTQTEIALSTLESKYIACSTAMHELVPLRRLMDELSLSLSLNRDSATIVSTVWEDNNGALAIANKAPPFMTPRTKHIAIKYHWSRGKIRLGKIEVEKIDTAIQKADIFTKGLRQVEFESTRILVMGW